MDSRFVPVKDARRLLPPKRLRRQLDSTMIHFDYDCFYAAVVESETPAYRSLPLAVQQKQIVVTCNYEARRRGLYKLQLIAEAKKICPEAVIVLGEDLTRFRNASKQNYAFLASFSWNQKVERLGFDEVFMDVSDMIEYNIGLLNPHGLSNSYFCLSKQDPTAGFAYDASRVAGHTYPELPDDIVDTSQSDAQRLRMRLTLASHLAKHLREQLESQKGYTCTAGISTNKLLSKLVGNVHKPDSQTTLLPPYIADGDDLDNVTSFIDGHDIGKIPGIGFKMAQRLRAHVLQRAPEFNDGLVYGGTKEAVFVRDVRRYPGMGPETLQRILGGPGTPHGIGGKMWGLLNGCDGAEVDLARQVPRQISIEDSYIRLDTLDEAVKELRKLSVSLLNRMHADLLEADEDVDAHEDMSTVDKVGKRWLAYPKTLRLSTRPRPPQNPDGSRHRSFARISRSAPMPNYVFSLKESVQTLSDRLVSELLLPLFRKLHPEKRGWNLSLVNIAATAMADAASEKGGAGRDISKMFRTQDDMLRPSRVDEETGSAGAGVDVMEAHGGGQQMVMVQGNERGGSEDFPTLSQEHSVDGGKWESEDEEPADDDDVFMCDECRAVMPTYAMAAHSRWHVHG